MIIICAWCSKYIRETDDGTNRVSYGICEDCAHVIREQTGITAAPTGRTHETHPRELGTGGAAFFNRDEDE